MLLHILFVILWFDWNLQKNLNLSLNWILKCVKKMEKDFILPFSDFGLP